MVGFVTSIVATVIVLSCTSATEDYACAECTSTQLGTTESFCGSEDNCREFVKWVLQYTIGRDSISWNCKIEP